MLPRELCIPVPSIFRGCMYKLTWGGAGQEPRADPLPPLLPPPGVGTAKVVSVSSTMVPATSTGLTRSQLRFPKPLAPRKKQVG